MAPNKASWKWDRRLLRCPVFDSPYKGGWWRGFSWACRQVCELARRCWKLFACSCCALFLSKVDQGLLFVQLVENLQSCLGKEVAASWTRQRCSRWPRCRFWRSNRSKPGWAQGLCSICWRCKACSTCHRGTWLTQSRRFSLRLCHLSRCSLVLSLCAKFLICVQRPYRLGFASCNFWCHRLEFGLLKTLDRFLFAHGRASSSPIWPLPNFCGNIQKRDSEQFFHLHSSSSKCRASWPHWRSPSAYWAPHTLGSRIHLLFASSWQRPSTCCLCHTLEKRILYK